MSFDLLQCAHTKDGERLLGSNPCGQANPGRSRYDSGEHMKSQQVDFNLYDGPTAAWFCRELRCRRQNMVPTKLSGAAATGLCLQCC
jgi:hypothetical protein